MQIEISAEDKIQLPYISKEGIYEGEIKEVSEVEEGTPHIKVLYESKAGLYTDRMYVSVGAAKKIRDMIFWIEGVDTAGQTIDSARLKAYVGKKVAFKIVPEIDANTGKVYYKTPFTNFVRNIEDKDTLQMSTKETQNIIAVKEHLSKAEGTTGNTAIASATAAPDDDLPF